MPEMTLRAVADHGQPHGNVVAGTYEAARNVFRELQQIGIDFSDVVESLEKQGLASFAKSWEELITSVTSQLRKAGAEITPGGATKPISEDGQTDKAPPSDAPHQVATSA